MGRHEAAKINKKLTAIGIKELVTGKLINDLGMDFNQKLKAVKNAGKEMLEEGKELQDGGWECYL